MYFLSTLKEMWLKWSILEKEEKRIEPIRNLDLCLEEKDNTRNVLGSDNAHD